VFYGYVKVKGEEKRRRKESSPKKMSLVHVIVSCVVANKGI